MSPRQYAVGAILFWIASGLTLLWAFGWFVAARGAIHEVSASLYVLTAAVLGGTGAILYALYLIRLDLWRTRNPDAAATDPAPATAPSSQPSAGRRARVDEAESEPKAQPARTEEEFPRTRPSRWPARENP